MTTHELLSSLRERDVRLWVEDGRLKCDAPPGALDQGLRAQLTARKQELMTLIAQAQTTLAAPRSLVPLKPTGELPPLFARPGHNGDVFCYQALSGYLDPRQPLFGVEPKGHDGSDVPERVEEIAKYEVEQIRGFQPVGPYHIAGFCAGGAIAFESARQLVEAGEDVARVMLFGAPFPSVYRNGQVLSYVRSIGERARHHAPSLTTGSATDRLEYIRGRVHGRAAARHDPALIIRRRIEETTMAAVKSYEPGPYPGRVDVFLPSEVWRHSGEQFGEWGRISAHTVEHVGPDGADGDNMLTEPHVRTLAYLLSNSLQG